MLVQDAYQSVSSYHLWYSYDVATNTRYFIGLVNGSSANQGRVEIFHKGVWGTVCDDVWSSDDAKVVCRQLGYLTDGAIAYNGATFGQGNGSIILNNVICIGSELSILDCPHNEETKHICDHDGDAGVFCHIPGI